MTTIGPVYPAQLVVSQAEVKLVADQAAAAGSLAIKADEQNLTSAKKSKLQKCIRSISSADERRA